MKACSESALKIAQILETHPKIQIVIYLGLQSHPKFEVAHKKRDVILTNLAYI